jgi:hypothetical protein
MEPTKLTLADVYDKLCEPFPVGEERYRVLQLSQDRRRGKPCAYIDARAVYDRLDAIVGPDNWETKITEMPSGAVICELTVLGKTKTDKGMVNHKTTDRAGEVDFKKVILNEKGSASDGLKRAAVQFGIGRYLYAMDLPWVRLTDKGYLPDGYLPPHRGGIRVDEPGSPNSFQNKVDTPNDVANFAARPASAARIKTIRDMLGERDINENHERVLKYLEKNSAKTLDELTNQAAGLLVTALKDIPRVTPRGTPFYGQEEG